MAEYSLIRPVYWQEEHDADCNRGPNFYDTVRAVSVADVAAIETRDDLTKKLLKIRCAFCGESYLRFKQEAPERIFQAWEIFYFINGVLHPPDEIAGTLEGHIYGHVNGNYENCRQKLIFKFPDFFADVGKMNREGPRYLEALKDRIPYMYGEELVIFPLKM